jgi:hypothetical protein
VVVTDVMHDIVYKVNDDIENMNDKQLSIMIAESCSFSLRGGRRKEEKLRERESKEEEKISS